MLAHGGVIFRNRLNRYDKDERRAEARINSPANIGLMLMRTMSMTEGLLDLLEDDYKEFRVRQIGVPKGYEKRLTEVANLLDALTLSYSRYRKAEQSWADQMGPEEKLEAVSEFAVALYKDRPDFVTRWANQLIRSLQAAGDATRIAADNIPAPSRKNMTMDDVIEQTLEKSPGSWADE